MFGRPISKPGDAAMQYQGARPRPVNQLAFHRQEGKLLERVQQPERRVELQAVDHGRRVPDIDVLRTQVAVTLDDAPSPQALQQRFAVANQERVERVEHSSEQVGRKTVGAVVDDFVV